MTESPDDDQTPQELETQLRDQTGRYQFAALIFTIIAVLLNVGIGALVLAGAERDARQAEAIDGLVVRIDCRQRDTLQSVVDGLAAQGLLEPGAVRVILDDCEGFATTTTTTEGNP